MDKEYFWSVAIEESQIQAAIWTITDGEAKILAVAPGSHWSDKKDLIDAADTTLSAATQNLQVEDEDIEPSDTVFGLPPSWVEEGKIKKEHLESIKSICDKLSLNPKGFVVLPEAIANFVRSEEGTPISAVIIGVGSSMIDVSIVKLGNLMGTVNVSRSVSIVDDVLEGLARFSDISPMPSRFLIYNSNIAVLEEARDQLIKADWVNDFKDKVKILHNPQIEIIEPERKMIAVSLAGATEIGHVNKIEFGEKEDGEVAPGIPNKNEAESGFVMGRDIGSNIKNTKTKVNMKSFALLASLKDVVKSGKKAVTKMKFGNSASAKGPLNMIIIGTFIVIILLCLGWWFLPKAEVTILVAPKTLNAQASLAIDPKKDAKAIHVEVETTKTRQTTGTKLVGETAKGKITIRNGTAVDILLPESTVIVSKNNLRFVLDNEASVSAATSPTSPGTGDVTVSAESIGSDYNLGKDETFEVGNYPKSDVDAVSNNEFTGGSSKQIVAVGKDDLSSLESDTTKELLSSADKKVEEGLAQDEYYIASSKQSKVVSKTFDHAQGDEASSLKLTMKLAVDAVTISKSSIDQLAQEKLKGQVPTGYALRDDQIEVNFKGSQKLSDGTWKVEAEFVANLLPEVNTEDVARKITGKYPEVAQNYLASTTPGFVKATIRPNIGLPGKLGSLPHVTKNISVIIEGVKQ